MANASYYKVLWQEGMLVGPHHFQQWDHYQEATVDLRVRHLIPYSWGIMGLDVIPEQLRDCRVVEIKQLRAVFQSGVVVDIPGGDQTPEPRQVPSQLFSGTVQGVGVYLALPAQLARRGDSCCPPTSSDMLGSRYLPFCVAVPDENSGQNELEITAARKNLRLLFGSEPAAGYERLKIAELVVKEGAIVMNEAYIPPCLVASASPRILTLIENLIRALAVRLSPPESEWLNAWPEDKLWLLSHVGGLLAQLKHFSAVKMVHPELIYRSLLQFAGQLSVLSRQIDVPASIAYDHEKLDATFRQVEGMLYLLLEIMDRFVGRAPAPTDPSSTTSQPAPAQWG
jgi:type VI secretion system protein ImpJ